LAIPASMDEFQQSYRSIKALSNRRRSAETEMKSDK